VPYSILRKAPFSWGKRHLRAVLPGDANCGTAIALSWRVFREGASREKSSVHHLSFSEAGDFARELCTRFWQLWRSSNCWRSRNQASKTCFLAGALRLMATSSPLATSTNIAKLTSTPKRMDCSGHRLRAQEVRTESCRSRLPHQVVTSKGPACLLPSPLVIDSRSAAEVSPGWQKNAKACNASIRMMVTSV
jgi:hypothetical protein